jgi:hypothetical protein
VIYFDIDAKKIGNLITELQLTERQAKFALGRAFRRTAATLKKLSERGLKSELDVKKMAYLRRRLRFSRFSRQSFEGARLWYGANDIPVSALRGKLSTSGTGASFAGKAGSEEFKGGFVRNSRRGWGKTIFVRKDKARLPIYEASMPVKDRMDIFVEDEVFDKINDIFWNHFERDMKSRARGFGQRG